MIRHGNIFDSIASKESLLQAFKDASRGKSGARGCFTFEKRLARNLEDVHRELMTGSYTVKPYFSFMVHEPKPRCIYAPAFRDTVVQHAIYKAVNPLFNRTFIDHSYACRVGMGTHKAADYAQRALQLSEKGSYTLKLDIRKFFYRIDGAILRSLIERVIKDRRLVDLMMLFADYGEPIGIPIGNLLSQIYALIYLNPLDHFIKRELKVERYCRYVDDFILFGLSRELCEQHKMVIEKYLADALGLELSRSTIAPTSQGVNFVGYRTWASKRFIRKHSLYNFRRAAKRGRLDSVVSILGHAKKTHSLQNLTRSLQEKNNELYSQLPKIYHYRSNC